MRLGDGPVLRHAVKPYRGSLMIAQSPDGQGTDCRAVRSLGGPGGQPRLQRLPNGTVTHMGRELFDAEQLGPQRRLARARTQTRLPGHAGKTAQEKASVAEGCFQRPTRRPDPTSLTPNNHRCTAATVSPSTAPARTSSETCWRVATVEPRMPRHHRQLNARTRRPAPI
jgi:hypothetical protein